MLCCIFVDREDMARLAMGLLVLLLPSLGAFTALALAAIFLLDKGSRLLSASLALLLIMRPALAVAGTNLPLYVTAISLWLPHLRPGFPQI